MIITIIVAGIVIFIIGYKTGSYFGKRNLLTDMVADNTITGEQFMEYEKDL